MHLALGERRHLRVFRFAQLAEQQRAQLRGHAALHFQPHHLAEAPLEDLLLDHRQQVLGLLGRRDLEIREARDAEGVVARDLHAREEQPEVRTDEVLERQVLQRPHGHPARQRLGHLHAREVLDARFGFAQLHGEREREIGDVREWMPRIHRQRREHGENLRVEEGVHRQPLARIEVGHVQQPHPVLSQLRQHLLLEDARLLRHHLAHALVDAVEQLRRRHAIASHLSEPGRHLPADAGDAHHVEFVQVRADDREKLQPLQ